MRLLFASETMGIVSESELRDTTPCDWREVTSRAMSVRTARDFVSFVTDFPSTLFEGVAAPLGPQHELVDHLLGDDGTDTLRGSIVDAVDRSFPDIEPLDMVVIKSGTLGAYEPEYDPYGIPADPRGRLFGTEAVVSPPRGLYMVPFRHYKRLCANARALGTYAALANGDTRTGALARLDLGLPASVQAIDTRFFANINTTIEYESNHRSFQAFGPADMDGIRSALLARGFSSALTQTQDTKDLTRYPHSPIRFYPSSWSDAEVAADLFVTLVTISLSDYSVTGTTAPFETWHDDNGFHTRDHVNPTHALYHEIARLAEARSFRLCAYCGRPFLADRSRGNQAMYCSPSCNSQASAARHRRATELAGQGVSLQEAVALIGEEYRGSIERWYRESKANAENANE